MTRVPIVLGQSVGRATKSQHHRCAKDMERYTVSCVDFVFDSSSFRAGRVMARDPRESPGVWTLTRPSGELGSSFIGGFDSPCKKNFRTRASSSVQEMDRVGFGEPCKGGAPVSDVVYTSLHRSARFLRTMRLLRLLRLLRAVKLQQAGIPW